MAIGLALAFYLGGFQALYIAALLAVLEVSLSFDNAVVNAKVLETMDPVWQKRFIVFGIPIAVFGMRFLFPILIVSIVASLSMIDTFHLAVNDPEKYHHYLSANETMIFAFGGSFLLMVFLDFFFDEDREEKWVHLLESNQVTDKLSEVNNIEPILSIAIGLIITYYTSDVSVSIAYFSGVLLHSFIGALDDLLSTDGIRSGIMGFLYLEVLDASFSFDGVIGAFALSSDIFLIMIGLGIGAMFVRSMTLHLVEKKTLSEYIYLEHGAHYAILALAVIMFLKIFGYHISELITGSIGIGFIAFAFVHSLMANKKESNAD